MSHVQCPSSRALLFAALVIAAAACGKKETSTSTISSNLTPARNIAGTWKTTFAVPFKYQTDFCSSRETVLQADWMVTWVITAVSGSDNKVNIQMTYSAPPAQRVPSHCGTGSTGYVPLVSPQFLTGTVSSTSLTINDTHSGIQYTGSFTTDLMEGTWSHWECIIYCSGEYTETNQLKMIRQH